MKTGYGEKVALSGGDSCLSYSKVKGGGGADLLSDNINICEFGQLLMTSLSVSLKSTLKTMNAIKCQIHILLQFYVKQKKNMA